MKFKHLVLLSTALIFSQQLSAADNNDADRWFEMEVILFSQLGDKAQLKEQFAENTVLPKYKEIIDLLGPYLNPDIASLKQLLPSCDAPIYPESPLNQVITLIKEQPYYLEKSLIELEKSIVDIGSETLRRTSATRFSNYTDRQKNSDTEEQLSEEYLEKNSNLNLTIENNDIDGVSLSERSIALSPEALEQQTLLLKEAEAEFSPTQFIYADETASFTQLICTIPIEKFKEFNQSIINSTYENYTAFNINKVPSTINNSEDIFSDNDYLLNTESLQLKNIVKQLARSKNFRPLLHFGWRQKTKTKRLAVPMKVFAGENFGYQYEQELKKFQQQLMQEKKQEDVLSKALFDKPVIEKFSERALKQQALNERLQELMLKLPNLPTDTTSLLDEVNNDITYTGAMLNSTNMLAAPIKPPQNWTLNGFLKVEVDFYLHITADINVMNMSLAQLATQQLLPKSNTRESSPLKIINFKQDRRVRSKEIHYFDHPYMGMIIRILPYKKPIKKIDEVKESTYLN